VRESSFDVDSLAKATSVHKRKQIATTSLPITPTNPDHSIYRIRIHYESESRFGKSNTALLKLCVGND